MTILQSAREQVGLLISALTHPLKCSEETPIGSIAARSGFACRPSEEDSPTICCENGFRLSGTTDVPLIARVSNADPPLPMLAESSQGVGRRFRVPWIAGAG